MEPWQPLLAELLAGLAAEDSARTALRAALRRQAVAIAELRRAGVPTSLVAAKVAKARGETLALGERLRLAERLRKRASRGTSCPVDLAASHGQPPSETSSSDRVITPGQEELIMPNLVNKTTTTTVEEFLEDERDESAEFDEEVEEDEPEEEQDEPEPKPSRRKR